MVAKRLALTLLLALGFSCAADGPTRRNSESDPRSQMESGPVLRVCVSHTGDVSTVEVTTPSTYPDDDRIMVEAARSWKYPAPGKPFCHPVRTILDRSPKNSASPTSQTDGGIADADLTPERIPPARR
jgi:hypothetical protein